MNKASFWQQVRESAYERGRQDAIRRPEHLTAEAYQQGYRQGYMKALEDTRHALTTIELSKTNTFVLNTECPKCQGGGNSDTVTEEQETS